MRMGAILPLRRADKGFSWAAKSSSSSSSSSVLVLGAIRIPTFFPFVVFVGEGLRDTPLPIDNSGSLTSLPGSSPPESSSSEKPVFVDPDGPGNLPGMWA